MEAESSKLYKVLKDEKNHQSKQLLEAIIVLSTLSEAKCNMPAFLEIHYKFETTKSRDKYFDQFFCAVETFAQKYQENTNGYGLVAVLTTDEQTLKRSRREVTAEVTIWYYHIIIWWKKYLLTNHFLIEFQLINPLNLAESYSEDFPVIFNIILWFGVLIAFSMLAICYAIAAMDPGRDSIIYRMTSTRIKKDN